MTDPERTLRILGDLHATRAAHRDRRLRDGVLVASRLKHMPVDILKIDRTFVREVNTDGQSGEHGVGDHRSSPRTCGMTPLAEGIETEDEWRFLVAHGCQPGRGSYFSRPVAGRGDPRDAPAGGPQRRRSRAAWTVWI